MLQVLPGRLGVFAGVGQGVGADSPRRALQGVGGVAPAGLTRLQHPRPDLGLFAEQVQHLFDDPGIAGREAFEVGKIDRSGDVSPRQISPLASLSFSSMFRALAAGYAPIVDTGV